MAGDAFLLRLPKTRAGLWCAAYVALSVLEACLEGDLWSYAQLPLKLVGIAAMWSVYDRFVRADFSLSAHRWLSMACGCTFFIYLFHIPTLNIVRKLLVVVFGHTSAGFALSYLLSPWLFVVCAMVVAQILRKYLPRFYAVVTGGR